MQEPHHNGNARRESLADARVLVTGASGYIAPHLCRRLAELGSKVSAVSRRPPQDQLSDCLWETADLSDFRAARELVGKAAPDYIFHLAGLAKGGRELENVLPTFHSNLTTLVNMLTAASASAGLRRFVVASSLEEPDRTEPEPLPSSPYAASKWAGSAYARMFHKLYGTPAVLARIFMTYGPGFQDQRKLIPYAAVSLLRGEAPRLAGGRRKIDWIYVDDVVEGLIATAMTNGLEGEMVDIGSGTLTSIEELVGTLGRIVNPRIPPVFGAVPDRAMEQVRAADIHRTWTMLNWKPQVELEDGLRRTAEWFESQIRLHSA